VENLTCSREKAGTLKVIGTLEFSFETPMAAYYMIW